jgi:hypothetical protein
MRPVEDGGVTILVTLSISAPKPNLKVNSGYEEQALLRSRD